MSMRKTFYIIIGLEILALVVLTLMAVKGTESISLCRYDLTHPFGYIPAGDIAMIKQLHGKSANTTCSKNVFTAIYFAIYVLLLTTLIYLLILFKRLFTKPKKNESKDE